MVHPAKRADALRVLTALVDNERMREDSLDAIIALGQVGHGKLLVDVPRAHGRPIEASVIMGGLQLTLFETREIA